MNIEERDKIIDACIEDLKTEFKITSDKKFAKPSYKRYYISESNWFRLKPFLIKLFKTGYKVGQQ